MIILTISTLYWDEEKLSVVNVVGMVVCVGGITLHVVFKLSRARGTNTCGLLNWGGGGGGGHFQMGVIGINIELGVIG